MLGGTRLSTFAFRAAVSLLIVSVLWVGLADDYNRAVVAVAGPLTPAKVTLSVLGQFIVFDAPDIGPLVSLRGFALHYGLVLVAVLVLAAVGLGVVSRVVWLAILGAAGFASHVAGVALLAWGVVWAGGRGTDAWSVVHNVYAVFWGLVPAAIGGFWCFAFWLPRVTPPRERPTGGEGSANQASTAP